MKSGVPTLLGAARVASPFSEATVCTVKELVRVTHRAIHTYAEVKSLELECGAKPIDAEVIAQESAMRHAIAELIELLEVDSCDL